jgi:hypothetical protein
VVWPGCARLEACATVGGGRRCKRQACRGLLMCGLTRGLDLAVLRESIRRSETAATGPPQSGGHGRPEVRPPARLVAPWLRPRRAKPAGAMDGRAGVKAGPHLGCDRAGPSLPGAVDVRLDAWPRPRRAPGVDSTVGDRRYRAAAKRRPRSPGGATARPAGRTLAATTPGQACRGHGWPGRREIQSPRSSRKFSRSATRLE